MWRPREISKTSLLLYSLSVPNGQIIATYIYLFNSYRNVCVLDVCVAHICGVCKRDLVEILQ